MADTAINTYPTITGDLKSFYASNVTNNALGQVLENRVANSVGKTVSNKGEMFYVDANGLVAELTIGANGSIPYAASGLPAWLGPGTANQLLRMNSGATAPEWATVANNLVQISKQTVSSPVASVVFTSLPSSGYSKFILVGINVISAVAATSDIVYAQVSTDNGSTFKTTSGDYYDGTSARTFLSQATVPASTSTLQYGEFVMEFVGLGNSARATSGIQMYSYNGISTTSVTVSAALRQAMRVAAEADNAIRIVTDGGENISSGVFILYGVIET